MGRVLHHHRSRLLDPSPVLGYHIMDRATTSPRLLEDRRRTPNLFPNRHRLLRRRLRFLMGLQYLRGKGKDNQLLTTARADSCRPSS